MADRNHGVTRLEGFSDAVFGFALTLLVVMLEVPENSDELRRLINGMLPFALTFAMVCWIWYEHNVFFRRYGLQDPWTVFLNCVLLFVVLFYVYPLKFLTFALTGQFAGLATMRSADWRLLMLVYSGGVLAIFVTFILMHRHAWRRRVALGLDEGDLIALRFSTRAHVISASLAIVSLILAFSHAGLAAPAGMLYMLMGPLHAWNGYQSGKALSAYATRQRAAAGSSAGASTTAEGPVHAER
jgi:uncharacterized membrane protein